MSRIRHRDIVARVNAVKKGGGSAPLPAGETFWSFTLSVETEIAITVQTLDEAAAPIVWGDGTFDNATHDVEIRHTLAAGSYELKIGTPDNIKSISISGNTGVGGVIGVAAFTAIQVLAASGCALDSFDAGSIPATLLDLNVSANSLDAGGIDTLLEALNNAGGVSGSLDYGLNPGSADEARSPEGAMAKMLLSGKGWLIVS